jgi:tetratricopeptide (TPR) repeat protein
MRRRRVVIQFAILLVVNVAFVAFVYWGYAPLFAVRRGDHARAHVLYARHLGFLGTVLGMKSSARYMIALCLFQQGKLDAALAAIAAAELPPRLATAAGGIEGTILLLQKRELERAVALLQKAYQEFPMRSTLLALANARLASGDQAGAAADFETTERSRGASVKLGVKTQLFRLASLDDAKSAYLRGLYLLQTGRAEEAQHDLAAASQAQVPTVYAGLATALLGDLPRQETESVPPSSLSAISVPRR